MFRAIFGRDSQHDGSADRKGPVETFPEIEQTLDLVLNPAVEASERRANAYALRELMGSERQDLSRAYASAVLRRLKEFSSTLSDPENEEIAQTLLEILIGSTEKASQLLVKTGELTGILMSVAQASPLIWVRISAIQALQAFTAAAPSQTVEHLQAIPSALETLVGFLSDDSVDVRNEMIVLLSKLTDCSEQMRKFMTFCDGPSVLLKIATEERDSIVSSDCLSVCINILRDNSIGQKLFVETQAFLRAVAELLQFDPDTPDPTPVMLRVARCVDIVRILVQGRLESKLAIAREFNGNIGGDDKRLGYLKDVQNKLGATPKLLENLYTAASDVSALVEDTAKREAMHAIGDLVCRHPRNAALLERLRGFSFIASVALTSARWLDAKAAAYAWVCALDGAKEGEQRAITLLGHAVAPLPESVPEDESGDQLDHSEDDAASLVARALYRSVESVVALREEVYVDPARVTERRSTMWRALQMWELLLCSPAAKEIALRVKVDTEPLFTSLCRIIGDLLTEKDETEAVKELVLTAAKGLVRLLIVWVADTRTSADFLLSSASNLFLLTPIATPDAELNWLGSVLVATCLISTWNPKEKPVVFGLIENKWTIGRFLQVLTQAPVESEVEPDWNSDECTHHVVDKIFFGFAARVASQADALLVKGASSTPILRVDDRSSGDVPASQPGIEPPQLSAIGQSDSSELMIKYKKLEQDYAQVLLVLAHQELERQSLLQTIQDLGGKEALDAALRRSAALLAKAFEGYDTNGSKN